MQASTRYFWNTQDSVVNALLLVWEFEGVNSEAICVLLQRNINGFVSFVKLLQIIDKSMSVSIVFWMVGA